MEKSAEEKIRQMQVFEQNMQTVLVQKQNFQMQLLEIDSALKEMENSKEHYKIVGNIMVKTEKQELKKDLESKKELLELRLKNLDKQESQIKEEASKIQQELVKLMAAKK